MATELDILSLNQLQKLALQQHLRQQSSMWNYTSRRRPTINNDESWEVRAFEEDTGSAMGTTWPPRSYTCTFCQREFRSAQALGGHMNIHRRDRARLQQSLQGSTVASSSLPTVFSSPESTAGGGLCLLYPIPHPASISTSAYMDLPSTLLSISPYSKLVNFPVASLQTDAHLVDKVGMMRDFNVEDTSYGSSDESMAAEELDLELRLAW